MRQHRIAVLISAQLEAYCLRGEIVPPDKPHPLCLLLIHPSSSPSSLHLENSYTRFINNSSVFSSPRTFPSSSSSSSSSARVQTLHTLPGNHHLFFHHLFLGSILVLVVLQLISPQRKLDPALCCEDFSTHQALQCTDLGESKGGRGAAYRCSSSVWGEEKKNKFTLFFSVFSYYETVESGM